MLGSFNTDAAV